MPEPLVSRVGNSICPVCRSVLDGVGVVRYDGPFICPNCKKELRVPGYYKLTMGVVSFGVSLILCSSIGLRGVGFVVGVVVFLLPALFSVAISQRKISPPKLLACENDPSPFS